jgi:hypothetical protein
MPRIEYKYTAFKDARLHNTQGVSALHCLHENNDDRFRLGLKLPVRQLINHSIEASRSGYHR